MSDDLNTGELLEVSLKTLRLRPGIVLNIQRMRDGAPVIGAKFIAAIEGKGVMLTPSGMESHKTDIIIGDEYLIQGFTGQTDFSFTAPVLNVFTAPFAHALVAYPAAVKAKQVRKSMRMKTALPATISPRGQENPIEVSIVDLSADGAMISSPNFLGGVGSLFDMAFPIEFDDVQTNLNIVAKLRHRTSTDNEGGRIGLSFENVSREHKLLLNYFVSRITEENSFIIEP
jgi:c-di-GMP-binding flagellar brake protein YcgR